jgi:hypothetical protein
MALTTIGITNLRPKKADYRVADGGENDVGPHGESTERPPEPWPGAKRRFTFLPTSISRSQATDHGRDA